MLHGWIDWISGGTAAAHKSTINSIGEEERFGFDCEQTNYWRWNSVQAKLGLLTSRRRDQSTPARQRGGRRVAEKDSSGVFGREESTSGVGAEAPQDLGIRGRRRGALMSMDKKWCEHSLLPPITTLGRTHNGGIDRAWFPVLIFPRQSDSEQPYKYGTSWAYFKESFCYDQLEFFWIYLFSLVLLVLDI